MNQDLIILLLIIAFIAGLFLWASVNTAYTPGELEDLRHQGIDIDLRENFVTYCDTLIPNEGTDYQKSCSFTIPIPRYKYNIQWPFELRITWRDTLNERIARIHAGDIDSTTYKYDTKIEFPNDFVLHIKSAKREITLNKNDLEGYINRRYDQNWWVIYVYPQCLESPKPEVVDTAIFTANGIRYRYLPEPSEVEVVHGIYRMAIVMTVNWKTMCIDHHDSVLCHPFLILCPHSEKGMTNTRKTELPPTQWAATTIGGIVSIGHGWKATKTDTSTI